MKELELKCFEIIASVGEARSMYINAISKAKKYDFEEARKLIEEGEKVFGKGHEAHLSLVQKEAEGNGFTPTVLLLHAEDQLMSAEGFKIIANEFIQSYEKIKSLEERVN